MRIIPRVAASVPLTVLAVIAVNALFYGSAMSAFTARETDSSSPSIIPFLTVICLVIPILCIWIPRRIALLVGGLALVPVLLYGCVLLIVPPVGIITLVPAVIWFVCARVVWKELRLNKNLRSRHSGDEP